jgi:hypothetical protein
VTVSAPTATDNCAGTITGTTNDPLNYTAQGTYTITWSYDDGNGNTSTQSQTVIVEDITAPDWSDCPSPISAVNDLGDCTGGTIFWTTPTVSDNCDASPNVTLPTWSTGDSFPLGITTVTYSAVDVSGNTGTCSFTVEVTILDADNDGTCDELDLCPGGPEPGTPCDDGEPSTLNDVIQPNCTCAGTGQYVDVAITVLLDGPYNDVLDLMGDNLRVSGLIPASQPYGTTPFNYMGTENISPAVLAVVGSNAIVDWVLVELRDKSASNIVLSSRAGLLQRDGDLVDLDGTSPLRFENVMSDDYYVAVRHRNHLGVMTASILSLGPVLTEIDLTDTGTPNFGTTPPLALLAQKARDGKRMLWAGNAAHDNQVKYAGSGNDRDPILVAVGSSVPTNTVSNVYTANDVNMNGIVSYAGSGNDRDPILVTIGSTVPTAIRTQQLP